ncbi:MHYT domain-containing protein [Sphingomonas turrisvirgatae]|nr:MHYT domain-containing protein [Sphingomonas turrisvirgatae]
MTGAHDDFLVALSIGIAIFASYTALSLAGRIRASRQRARRVWLGAAAVTLGGGIWAMHFVAMLAFSMPGMTISYDVGPTLLSLALAIGFTGAGLATLNWQQVTPARTALAGALIATGVVGMHYLGMAAMRMPAALRYDPVWVAISIVIALVAATAAVWLASRDRKLPQRIAAAVVMGAAIAGMHYAGMYAATFTMAGMDDAQGLASVGQTYLAITISFLTSLILLLSLGAAQLERVFQRAARREARIALRLQVADILRGRSAEVALPEVAALMGAHFGVTRTGFGDLDPLEDVFDYSTCWTDGSAPPLLGRFPAAAFGPKIVAALTAGRTVAIGDLFASDLSDESRTQATAREVDTRAILVVPFVRGGRLRTIVYLNDRKPRHWRADEISFMEEIAERVRLVIERSAVEDQLRELNASLEMRVEQRTRELQRAEAGRRAADALYRAYFEHTPDPLSVIAVGVDGEFLIEQMNPAHEAALGVRLDAIRGKRLQQCLPPRIAQRMVRAYRHIVQTREIAHYRHSFVVGGEPRHWDTTLVPLSEEGRVTRIVASSRDVTRQVAAEEALRQAQKMEAIGQLTGGVAHDFNNLLTPILGSLDRLHRKGVVDERDRRFVAGALQSAERARTLIQRLLSFARRQPLQIAPVDVSELVRSMADLISSTIGPQIKVAVDAPAGVPAATADANQLEMALLNLAVNARDAMPQGGQLRIGVSHAVIGEGDMRELGAGRYICLCVADTGVGMDQETQRRAIEPFFSTKGVGQGTGLGLSMAHGLAAQLGGALTIDSQPGAGTQIMLWLPESVDAAQSGAGGAEADEAHAFSGTVLLVDDDELVRDSAAQMLRDIGLTVTCAASAAAALDQVDAGMRPDLLVTDHLMPGMTGSSLALQLRERLPGIRLLIISGYADAGDIDDSLPRLSKPFVQADLVAALRDLG